MFSIEEVKKFVNVDQNLLNKLKEELAKYEYDDENGNNKFIFFE